MTSKTSCERCDRTFGTQKELVAHLREPVECRNQFVNTSRVDLLKNLVFACKRCTTEFNQKVHLIKHLKNAFACPVKNIDIDRKEYLKELDTPKDPPTLKCEYCDKKFTTQTNRYRHQRICPQGPNPPPPKPSAISQDGGHDNVANTGNIDIDGDLNNITFAHTIINNYGSEDLSHLQDKLIKYFLDLNISKLLRDVHFDSKHPENMTIKPNIEENTLKKHMNGRWIPFDLLENIHQIILDNIRILERVPKDCDLSTVSPEVVNQTLKSLEEIRKEAITGHENTPVFDDVQGRLAREEMKARATDPKNKKPYAFVASPPTSEEE